MSEDQDNECTGEPRPGDGAAWAARHVWARRWDGTAFCVKCKERLDVAGTLERLGEKR